MQQFLLDLIWTYRYLALFGLLALGIIGLPIPDETLMTFVGSLTAYGHLTFGKSLTVSFSGSMTGMLISYFIGRRVGKPFLDRFGKWFHLTPNRLAKGEKWFQKYGAWAIVFGYFVPGVRHLTCYLAGMSGIRFWRYFVYAGSGAFVWCFTFITLGRVIGRNWETVLHLLHVYMGRGVAIGILVIALGLLLFIWLRRRKSRPAR
ncbi:DedA family protein [Paenibacillus koleovorans]|uniref:DedA family protein n=1 Tax=Paenibacillus koleovorans TaxID=121608 RepID=UPI001FE77335|nr:DedA family protein [Paenibacillus koleovorans]